MSRKEQFKNGDLVLIANDLGSAMDHFPGKGTKAIVIGSYRDEYGGSSENNSKEYTLFLEGKGKCSWYHEHQLTLIERRRHDLLETWQEQLDAKERDESSIPWIVEHWNELKNEISSTSILALFRTIGFQSAFERNGEYFCLWSDWYESFGFFDAIITKSLDDLRRCQKPNAKPEQIAEVERCWHLLHPANVSSCASSQPS